MCVAAFCVAVPASGCGVVSTSMCAVVDVGCAVTKDVTLASGAAVPVLVFALWCMVRVCTLQWPLHLLVSLLAGLEAVIWDTLLCYNFSDRPWDPPSATR